MGDGAPPENSVAAAEAALAAGADGVEVDVRLTRDGVAVCVHDPDLRRVAGMPWVVERSESDQLRRVRVAGEPVATLAEIVSVARTAAARLVLDLKPAGRRAADLVRAVADALPMSLRHAAVLSSADPAIVAAAVRLMPATPIALITGPGEPLDDAVRRACLHGLDLHAHVHALLADAGTAQQAMSLGLVVRAWTVNRRVDADLLRVLGVAAVITDVPATLRRPPALSPRRVDVRVH